VLASPDNITFSFIKLQRLGAAFDELRTGVPLTRGHERTVHRLGRELGSTSVPLLLRKLAARDEREVRLAQELLRLAGAVEAASRARVTDSLRGLAAAPDEALRKRAAALLGEIGDSEEQTAADDPSSMRDRSLRELARCLDTAAEVARAADLLVVQLDDEELLSFLDDFAASEAPRAAALIDELLVRDDLDERTRSELRRLRAPLRTPHKTTRPAARATVRVGEHEDGRCVIVGTVRRDGSRPVRYRSLWAVIDEAGQLVDAGYCSELTGGAVQRDLIAPMREEGFEVERAATRLGRTRLIAATRATIAAGGELPSDFYLGRDIFGMRDEHWTHGRDADGDLTALLARAIDLQSIGEHARAKPLFERYVACRPDDAEGLANLGVCLMEMGEVADACEHLGRATQLDPEEALHHWNLAAAAHRAGQLGRCYLALKDYIANADARGDAGERLQSALASIAEYERIARLEHG